MSEYRLLFTHGFPSLMVLLFATGKGVAHIVIGLSKLNSPLEPTQAPINCNFETTFKRTSPVYNVI